MDRLSVPRSDEPVPTPDALYEQDQLDGLFDYLDDSEWYRETEWKLREEEDAKRRAALASPPASPGCGRGSPHRPRSARPFEPERGT